MEEDGRPRLAGFHCVQQGLSIVNSYFIPCVCFDFTVNRELKKDKQRYRRVYDKAKTPAERLLASPEVSEENKQRIKATAEECNFVKISVKLKVTLDKFYERLARRENIYD